MVVAQFVAASFLLIAILVVSAQNRGLRQAALQSDQDPIILISSSLGAANLKFDSLQRELLRQPHIKAASAALVPPWRLNCFQEMIVANPSSGAARWAACSNLVNYDLFETLGIKLLAGRAFDRQHADDVTLVPPDLKRMPAVVIDQVLATQYGWTDPQQAIGKIIYWGNWSNSSAPPFRFRVIGVTQPTVLTLVGTGATANFFALTPDMASLPIVRLSKTDVPAALKEVESVWNEFAPGVALKWRFADDLQNEAYRLFRLIGAACTGIALLALAVAVLGMIGMSVHVIGRRTHEIGVRKTIGASAGRVVAMLLQDFSRPVVIANLVAWPLAFIAMRYYLSVFTYRIDLSLAPFVASFALTVLIACLAVIVQAARAARPSPAIVLRHQ
jgi:putative ABC transport system permease protein